MDTQHQIDELNAQAWEFRYSDPDEAMRLGWQAYRLAHQEPAYLRGIAASLRTLSRLYLNRSANSEALAHALQALSFFEALDDKAQQATCWYLIGACYAQLGCVAEALECGYEAARLARLVQNRILESRALNLIGKVSAESGEVEAGRDYLENGLAIAREIGHTKYQADFHDNLCIAYRLLGVHMQSLAHGEAGLDLYHALGDQLGTAEITMSLGETFRELEDYEAAALYFQHALAMFRTLGNRYQETHVLINQGKLELLCGRPEEALDLLEQALELAEAHGYQQKCYLIHELLAALYRQQGDFEVALNHYQRFHHLKEGVMQKKMEKQRSGLRVVHDVETARMQNEMNAIQTLELQHEVEERQRAESALRKANDRLLKQAMDHEQLIEDLNAYAHNVAHDLKSPLALVIAYASLLAGETMEVNKETVADWSRSIYRAGMKMSQIIDELLMLASSRREVVPHQVVPMNTVIDEVQDRLHHMIKQYGATVEVVGTLPDALGHTPWVEEVWVNYISNAIKYGGKPAHVTVGATYLRDGGVRYWVKDNGDGLSTEQQAEVFKPFMRIEDKADEVEGHGLGLSIVRRIVDRLGGEISVESTNRPGEGCTFSFTLRTVQAAAAV